MNEAKRDLHDAFIALDERRSQLDCALDADDLRAAEELLRDIKHLAARIDRLREEAKKT